MFDIVSMYSGKSIDQVNLRRKILKLKYLVDISLTFEKFIDERKLLEQLCIQCGLNYLHADVWTPHRFFLNNHNERHKPFVILEDDYHYCRIGPFQSIRVAKIEAKKRILTIVYTLHTDSCTLVFIRGN